MRGGGGSALGSRGSLARLDTAAADMGCFCAVPEEFYCEVLLLDESKLTLTTQQQGIKVGTRRGRVRGWRWGTGARGPRLCEGCRVAVATASPRAVGRSPGCPLRAGREGGRASAGLTLSPFIKESEFDVSKDSPRTSSQLQPTVLQLRPDIFSTPVSS